MEKRSESMLAEVRRHIVPHRGMSNHMLETLISELSQFVSAGSADDALFRGVYPIDLVPQSIFDESSDAPLLVVVNLASHSAGEREGHFIVLYIHPQYCLYIDPVGLPCYREPLKSALRRLRRPVFSNLKRIQDITSSFCPMYAIAFCVYFTRGESQRPTFRPMYFKNDGGDSNDRSCIGYIQKMLDRA